MMDPLSWAKRVQRSGQRQKTYGFPGDLPAVVNTLKRRAWKGDLGHPHEVHFANGSGVVLSLDISEDAKFVYNLFIPMPREEDVPMILRAFFGDRESVELEANPPLLRHFAADADADMPRFLLGRQGRKGRKGGS